MLEALGIDWKLLLFQIINFLLLMFILKKVLYKPMLSFLENRSKKIEEGLAKAEKFEAEWQKIKEAEKERIAEVEKKATQMMEKARIDAVAREKEILELAQQKSLKIIDEAKKEISREKEKASEELKNEMSGFIVFATEKILGREMRDKDEKGFIKETIEALKNQ
ncbi:MAG: F0F1 ATP synthase subunit B [Candidatus Nealsonbacteria bacterium]|nr:F0F1 ATP synthase subunit B [Candidatus Nealsonbacteria bacterium]